MPASVANRTIIIVFVLLLARRVLCTMRRANSTLKILLFHILQMPSFLILVRPFLWPSRIHLASRLVPKHKNENCITSQA